MVSVREGVGWENMYSVGEGGREWENMYTVSEGGSGVGEYVKRE